MDPRAGSLPRRADPTAATPLEAEPRGQGSWTRDAGESGWWPRGEVQVAPVQDGVGAGATGAVTDMMGEESGAPQEGDPGGAMGPRAEAWAWRWAGLCL